jgi:hypothetical protein
MVPGSDADLPELVPIGKDLVPDRAAQLKNGILVADGRAMMLFHGSDREAKRYAEVVNAYAREFQGKATVHSVAVPSAVSFYLPEDQSRRSGSELENLEVVRTHLLPEVRVADVYGELSRHADEPIFLLTDHHWTGLGAYYGYRAFCQAASLTAARLETMAQRKTRQRYGSLARIVQDPALLRVKDEFDYYLPPVEYQAVRYVGPGQRKTQPASFVAESTRGYLIFLGGDSGLMSAETGLGNGRRALLIKNSYGNAFAPYLLSNFERVVVADYRYLERTIVELVKEYEITDIILLSSTMTINSGLHRHFLRYVLRGAGQRPVIPLATDAPKPEEVAP